MKQLFPTVSSDASQPRSWRIVPFPQRNPAPVAEHSFARDRAAVVTTAVLQIVTRALIGWFCHEAADLAGGRAAIEAILRDEFEAVARQTLNEIRREDG
jgi:hypothetical protein